MAYEVTACVVVAYILMGYIGMAYIVMAYIAMAYVVMADTVVAYIAFHFSKSRGCGAPRAQAHPHARSMHTRTHVRVHARTRAPCGAPCSVRPRAWPRARAAYSTRLPTASVFFNISEDADGRRRGPVPI